MGKYHLAACLAAALLTAPLGCCRIPPSSFVATRQSRPGRALGAAVAIVYSKHYQINMGGFERMHSFDIQKYAKIYLQLLTDGLIQPQDVFVPQPVTDQQVLLAQSPAFLRSLHRSNEVARYLEAPIVALAPAPLVDAGILHAFRYASGGTIEAARQALKHGIAVNLAGGYHHAKPDEGGGFNIYNDLAIAIRVLQMEGLIRKAMVVDLDVHQGNGTATIFSGDKSVFTFDMHEEDIYPYPKARCSLDIDLPAGTGDQEYLKILRDRLPGVMDRFQCDIVFLQGGCDVLGDDPLANLRLSREGVVARDAFVIDQCVARKLPVVMVLGGGYSKRAWEVQYASIRRTLLTYAKPSPAYPVRKATLGERLYVR